MGWLNVLLVMAVVASQTAELPPPFPRPGTTSLLENDVVAVWNVSWLKQQYPLHTHRYDLVGVRTPKAIASSRRGAGPDDSSTPRPGCFRRTAPMSPTWRKARATRRCGRS